MTIATRSYNPGFLTDEELRAMFCVRIGEFESLLETLRENTGESNQHVIVVGQRGSGKTTLLLRVALEVRSDPELSSRLYPIIFAEESYSVSTCGEFWLECLSRLAQQELQRAGANDLGRTVEDVSRERDDRILRERCLSALLDFAEREEKRLVLQVENLDMMFSDMMDPDAGWCLRKTLQTEPRIMMIGSATTRFGEIDRPDRALYDLFRVLTLQPLNREESAALCEMVSGKALHDGVVRRLQILTGGSPRLLSIVARFGAARSFRTLLSDLLDLVDEHTAYFKSHLESLPAQERRVYLALVELWKPATAREVAERARMGTSKCSAQLRRLIGRGVVSDEGGTERRKLYYVSERLYNIYYLLRRSRGTDSLVGALVRFMDAYYSRRELQEIVDRMVGELGVLDSPTRLIYREALRRLGHLPELAWHIYHEYPDHVASDVRKVTEEAAALLEQGHVLFDDGNLHGAKTVLDDLLRQYRTHTAPTVQEAVVKALMNKGMVLMRLDRGEEALPVFDKVVAKLEPIASHELRPVEAMALVNQSYVLNSLGQTQEAVSVCDKLVAKFADDDSDLVAEAVATALFNRGKMIGDMDRPEDAVATYDRLLDRFGSNESIGVLVSVASGQVNKAGTLVGLARLDDALRVCDETWSRFGNHDSPRVLQHAWAAMTIKGAILSVQGHTREHLATSEKLLEQLDHHDRRVLAGSVANHDPEAVLNLRLATLDFRVRTHTAEGDVSAVADDVGAILLALPGRAAMRPRSIRTLMAASVTLGADQMATLIRESPSADQLLPLTTALQWELGEEPRVATEIREVAKDMRRDLAEIREQLSAKEQDDT